MYSVAIVVGSLRKDSINKKLAQAFVEAAQGVLECSIVPLDDLPLYNQDNETPLPESVAKVKKSIEAADAVFFVTPEYNRSIPPVLKNAIDWCSRPAGDNSWGGKPAAIAGCSGGTVGTAAVQQHLRSILVMLGMSLMGQPELYIVCPPDFFDANGAVASEQTRAFFASSMKKFAAWIEKHHA